MTTSMTAIDIFGLQFYYANLHTFSYFFFFNDTATTEIYTLSLHDALPISSQKRPARGLDQAGGGHSSTGARVRCPGCSGRSEEHTSELQSHLNLVCRLLLEKKKYNTY